MTGGDVATPEGFYPDFRGVWYFKVTVGRVTLTGQQ